MNCPRCGQDSGGALYCFNDNETCYDCLTVPEKQAMAAAKKRAWNSPRLHEVLAERMGMTVEEYRRSLRQHRRGRLDYYHEEAHE